MSISPFRFQHTQPPVIIRGITGAPVNLQHPIADQICFTGKLESTAKPHQTWWQKIRHLLFTPFRWIKALWRGNEIQPGSIAPDFTLNDHAGRPIQLSQALKKGPVVLFFYPKNNTAFCTKQVKAFRDSHPNFQKLGATVFGISSDSEKSHQQFNEKQRLPFALLADPGGKIRKQYGAQRLFGFIPNRTTFVINGPTQQIRTVYSSQANIGAHINKALQGLSQKTKAD